MNSEINHLKDQYARDDLKMYKYTGLKAINSCDKYRSLIDTMISHVFEYTNCHIIIINEQYACTSV